MTFFEKSPFNVFCELAGSSLPGRNAFEQALQRRHLSSGEPLFLTGERRPHIFVVTKGLIKLTYETPKGESWIKGFAQAGICFASLTALAENGVTSYSAYAVVESAVVQIDFSVLERLAKHHIEWQRTISNAFKFYGQRKEQREMELLTLSPEERYQAFLQNFPDLASVIRQHDIAGYIRVTPVALSRIKSRLKAREE